LGGSKTVQRERSYSLYKDTLRGLVLRILADGPKHGYEILKEIERVTGGKWRPAAGTLYPLLEQLRNEGLIEVERVDEGGVRGGRKIVYRLSSHGWRELASMLVAKAKAKVEIIDFYLVGGARALRRAGYVKEAGEICETLRRGLEDLLGKMGGEC